MSKIISKVVFPAYDVTLQSTLVGKDEYMTVVTLKIHSPNRRHVDSVWGHLTHGTVRLEVTLTDEEEDGEENTD